MAVSIPQVITEDRASGAQSIDGSLKFDSGKSTHLQELNLVVIEKPLLGLDGLRGQIVTMVAIITIGLVLVKVIPSGGDYGFGLDLHTINLMALFHTI